MRVMANIKQQDNLLLEGAAKVLLQGTSVIWTDPLSGYNKVLASNQFALPVLHYLMWTQVWSIFELQQLLSQRSKKSVTKVSK